ncbi:10917_t:CDS:2, partial [Acaulospora morrowiae]
ICLTIRGNGDNGIAFWQIVERTSTDDTWGHKRSYLIYVSGRIGPNILKNNEQRGFSLLSQVSEDQLTLFISSVTLKFQILLRKLVAKRNAPPKRPYQEVASKLALSFYFIICISVT